MHHSSRLKLTTAFSLIFILVIGLSLIGFTKVITYAVGPTPKTSLKSLKVASVSPISNCGGWNAIVSPSPGQDNNLYGVAAISGNNAWAVGAVNNSGTSQTLVEHWNGTSWTVIASPSPGGYSDVLDSVVAISAKNVWAVGYSFVSNSSLPQTLIEHWNGMSWSVVPSPNAGGYNILSSVARVPGTSLLWAVGNYYSSANNTVQQTLIEQWNGTTWSIVPSPNPGSNNSLWGMAWVPGTSQLWAVGNANTSSSQTLTEFYC